MNNQLEPTQYANPPTSMPSGAFHERTTVGDASSMYPYIGETPMAPPPPIRKRRIGVIAIILTTAALVGLMSGVSYFAVSHYSGTSAPIYAGKNGNITNQPPVTPMASPTTTSVPTVNPTPVPTSVPAQVLPTPAVMPTPIVPTPTPAVLPTQPVPTPTPIPTAPYSAVDMYQHFSDAAITMGVYQVDDAWCMGWNCPWSPSGGAVFWNAIEEFGEPTVEIATFMHHQPAVDDAAVFAANGNSTWTYGNCILILYSDNVSSLPDVQSYLNVMQQFCN